MDPQGLFDSRRCLIFISCSVNLPASVHNASPWPAANCQPEHILQASAKGLWVFMGVSTRLNTINKNASLYLFLSGVSLSNENVSWLDTSVWGKISIQGWVEGRDEFPCLLILWLNLTSPIMTMWFRGCRPGSELPFLMLFLKNCMLKPHRTISQIRNLCTELLSTLTLSSLLHSPSPNPTAKQRIIITACHTGLL